METLLRLLSLMAILIIASTFVATAISSENSDSSYRISILIPVRDLAANPTKYIYLYTLAGRPLELNFSDILKALVSELGEVDIQYIHVYAYTGSRFTELPILIYTSVIDFKPFRDSPVTKLYVYEPGKSARIVIWLPRYVPTCKPVNTSTLPDAIALRGLWLLKVFVTPSRDPIASHLVTLLRNRLAEPLSEAIARELAKPIALCLYIAYEPPIPNTYLVISSVKSPNYVASYEIEGITSYEIEALGLLKALSLANEPITSIEAVEIHSIPLAKLGTKSSSRSEEESSTPTYWFVDVSPSHNEWIGIDEVIAKQELSTPEEKVKAIPERIAVVLWAKEQGGSEVLPTVTTITTPISTTSTSLTSATTITTSSSTSITPTTTSIGESSPIATKSTTTKSITVTTSVTTSSKTTSTATQPTEPQPGICVGIPPSKCRYYIVSKRSKSTNIEMITMPVTQSEEACKLALSLRIATIDGKILTSLPAQYYLIDPSKLNYVVATFDLSYSKIKKIIENAKEKVIAVIEAKAINCYSPVNISVDRIVILYSKEFETVNDNYISRNYVTISIFGTRNLNGTITQLPGGDIVTRIEKGIMHLYMSSRVNSVRIDMVIPPITGGSLVLEYRTIDFGLRIRNEGVSPIKVRICTPMARCSNWVTIRVGEIRNVSIEIPQPAFAYSLVLSNGVPIEVDIQKKEGVATELAIMPKVIKLRTRISTPLEIGNQYYGYSSIEASLFATYVPNFNIQEACYTDVAAHTNARSAYISARIFESYVKIRTTGLISLGIETTGGNIDRLLLISLNDYTSSLNVKEIDMHVVDGVCSELWVHAIVPEVVKKVEEVLSYIPAALSTVDVIAGFSGLEEVAIVIKLVEIPTELALEVASHAIETVKYCYGSWAKVRGPLVGGIVGINAGFIVKLGTCEGKVVVNRVPIYVKYVIEGSAGKLVDEIKDTVVIPIKGVPPS